MRLRRKKNALSILQSHAQYYHVQEHQLFDETCFNKKQPIHIEIGMGKGDFIIGMAKKYPHINFVGIERYDSVLAVAIEKLNDKQLSNLKLVLFDATEINQLFKQNSVDHIYLNFSDPWPKKRHAKRRLTSETFLNQYDQILVSKGCITQKSDNQALIEYSLVSFANHHYYFKSVSLNLHQDAALLKDNVMTEYERKFSSKGQPIFKIEVAKYD